ncbi:unnamed protein product, partial [Prorocentrum cordatum]
VAPRRRPHPRPGFTGPHAELLRPLPGGVEPDWLGVAAGPVVRSRAVVCGRAARHGPG